MLEDFERAIRASTTHTRFSVHISISISTPIRVPRFYGTPTSSQLRPHAIKQPAPGMTWDNQLNLGSPSFLPFDLVRTDAGT